MSTSTGNSLEPRFEYPQIFDIRVAGPIDSRMTISSLLNVDAELPQGVRYIGLLVFVSDIRTFYYFNDSTATNDFVPFSVDNTLIKFVYTATLPTTNGDILNHGLNSEDFTIQFFLDRELVTVDFEFLEYDAGNPTQHLNSIRLLPPLGYAIPAGLKAVIVS